MSSFVALCMALVLQVAEPAASHPPGLPLQGEEAEAFLRVAEVVERNDIPIGVTEPEQLVLTDGTRTLRAVWKTVDDFSRVQRLSNQRPEWNFRDTYKNEIAAYELDKQLGLGMVPPTVERTIDGERGSLQLWVEGAMTEADRRQQGIPPTNPTRWVRQIHTARLFHQLIYDTDYRNISNLLVDADCNLYVIDSSRGFRLHKKLFDPESLIQFSRSLLDRLRALDAESLRERAGRWLSGEQIKTLLARRDRILARAKRLVEENGEEAVLFP